MDSVREEWAQFITGPGGGRAIPNGGAAQAA
ncbi:hypothetical protein B551_0212510 [Cupriavidus sp. HPC(L)]|nr:hypothetical protein B551_0212510 [Cupriavidus sp. HPC(L)]